MSFDLLQTYYAAFKRGDSDGMLALLTDDVEHEPSQGKVRKGKAAFAEFLDRMNRCDKDEVIGPVSHSISSDHFMGGRMPRTQKNG